VARTPGRPADRLNPAHTWKKEKSMNRTRWSGVLAAAVLLAAALGAAPSSMAAGGAFPAHYAAPYLEMTSSSVGDMAADMSATGTRFYTLAFFIPSGGCTPVWEAGGALGDFASQITSLQNAGGNVIISFGGAAGGELAQTCTNVSSLQAAYASVVNTYHVTRLDFDIEGGPLDDTASNARRDQALAALQAANPAVQVDFTLPVAPNGLLSNATALLNDARSKGVKVSVVNIMTMDFGNGQNALADAQSAANATAGQLASLYGISSTAAWNMLGLTPIAGQNDDNEFFSQTDAQTLETFAASKGVAELSFWEVQSYDKATGYAYSRIFNQITGPGPNPTPTQTSGPIDARSTIQAENFSAQSGTQTETTTDTGGGSDVGYIANGDYIQFNNVNFGTSAVNTFTARVASGAAAGVTGNIVVHLDSLTGTTVATLPISPTGGWQTWQTLNAAMSATTGTHTVYLVFTSGQAADFVNINWFTFSGSVTPTPTPAPTRTAAPTATPTPAPTTGGISTTAWYSLVNRNSAKCVDARAAATANGTAIQQYTCNNTNAQQFQFGTATAGYYRVGNRTNVNQVLDVTGVSIANGALIQLWLYGGGANQQWQAVSEGSGYYHFVSRNSGKCLEVPGASTADSVQLDQNTCNGSTAQSFSLVAH
jgi:chitinase